ncbi:MAG: LacI family DNA-binding transcriptional regulator [Anaerolineae bacterium]|nr:LacI family DNA-binding transcriptional regulator [Anaerolineae bacterium]
MVTIHDVAKHAGVSESTVSRVLNRSPHVTDETRERVLAAVAKLGYTPRSYARAMKGKPSNAVALIISDVSNPFFAALTRGVEDFVQEQGYSLLLGNADRGKAKQRQYVDRVIAAGIGGMIIAPARNTLTDLKRLVRQGVALVIVDWRYPLPFADNVYCDSVDGARRLTDHLLSLGHRRIGIISGPHGDATAEDRVTGYRLALGEAGLPQDQSLIRFGQFTSDSGLRNCRRLLRLSSPPTAIVTCNNRLAAGAYDAIREAGLRVPEDLSMVSFDDVPFVPALASRMTVLAQPDYEMGRSAARLLLERMRGERRPKDRQEVVLPGRLVVRSSSAAPARLPTTA